mmetsp:Transcript_70279/g.139264  ORF Transcript_70279/g.139264 Transcript_70279/m.139264 type:complete len:458 (+) Transcript_70279:125-1498(+)
MQLLRALLGAFPVQSVLNHGGRNELGPPSSGSPVFYGGNLAKAVEVRSSQGFHHTLGWSPYLYALVFGIGSGLSLPVGACMGARATPARQESFPELAASFGAGCLLFAVTVELYARSIRELTRGQMIGLTELLVQSAGALLGARFYLVVSHQLTQALQASLSGAPPSPASEAAAASAAAAESEEEGDAWWEEQPVISAARYRSARALLAEGSPRNGRVSPREKARQVWRSLRATFWFRRTLDFWELQATRPRRLRGREKGLGALLNEWQRWHFLAGMHPAGAGAIESGRLLWSALFRCALGLLTDGIPEAVFMGVMAAEGHLTPMLILALLLTNIPEGFSSAAMWKAGGLSIPTIVGLWAIVCVSVGCISGLCCLVLVSNWPAVGQPEEEMPLPVLVGTSLVQGFSGGAMIASTVTVLLPEAFERPKQDGSAVGTSSGGVLCTAGVLAAIAYKALSE